MEELKLVLSTVSDLGGEAKWLFIFYLAKELIIYLIGFSVLGGTMVGIYKTVKNLIPAIDFIEKIRVIARAGSWISPGEKEDILAVLRKHYN